MRMIRIPLGRDGMAAFISDEDSDLASLSWYAHRAKNGYYAAYREGTGARRRKWLHREVMERILSRPLKPDEIADHINLNKLDNRRFNLRAATRSQNEANKSIQRGTSRFRGVSWDKRRKKWRVTINVNGKQKYLGHYDDEVNAAQMYNKAAIDNFGEYATLNILVKTEDFDEKGRKVK